MDPYIAFVIPTKNRRDLLAETLDSLTAQSDPRWQAIVVDDGSTDGTHGYLRATAREDDRIRWTPSMRSGACAARNQGASLTTAPLLVFLDSDDLVEPFAVAGRVAAMATTGADFLVTQGRCFRHRPDDLDTLWNGPTDDTPDDDLDRFLRVDVPWQTTGATWRRETFERVGGWDTSAPSSQDLELHLRALLLGLTYEHTPAYDFHWRIGDASRNSIGVQSVRPEHWAYRCRMTRKFAAMLRGRGLLTPRRREVLGGRIWHYVHQLRQRAGVRDATRHWDDCRTAGLVSVRRWLEGTALLAGFGRGQLRRPLQRWIDRTWSDAARGQLATTHTAYPVPPDWERACLAKRRAAREQIQRAGVSEISDPAPREA